MDGHTRHALLWWRNTDGGKYERRQVCNVSSAAVDIFLGETPETVGRREVVGQYRGITRGHVRILEQQEQGERESFGGGPAASET